MKPQRQRFRHDPSQNMWGDCHRTAIAMILNMERDDVPHFMENMDPELLAKPDSFEEKEVTRRINAFLELHGLAEFAVPLDGALPVEEIVKLCGLWGPRAPVILGGKSTTGVHHSVVIYEGQIYNPNWCELVGPCDNGFWRITILCPGPNWSPKT